MFDTIYNEDCLKGMERIPDHSIDLIVTDPPYGTTNLEWDNADNLPQWMAEFRRCIKRGGASWSFPHSPLPLM